MWFIIRSGNALASKFPLNPRKELITPIIGKRNMNQSDEDFSHQDLRGADLGHSTFYRANFLHADLWNCGFRDSDLTGARNLSQAQLAATDLTNAKLPEALATFEALDSVKDLSEKSSRVLRRFLYPLFLPW